MVYEPIALSRSSDHPELVEARVSTKPVLSTSKGSTQTGIDTPSGQINNINIKQDVLVRFKI
jgi:hypothetical protein